MKRSKGQFTLPNMVGVVVLFFMFAVLFEPLKMALLKSAQSAGGLTAAVMYTIPALILVTILASPFMLAQKKIEKKRSKRRGGRR